MIPILLPEPFACRACGGDLDDSGACRTCEKGQESAGLLSSGCGWCGRSPLSATDMEDGWFEDWRQARVDLGREPGVVCRRCLDASELLDQPGRYAFTRVLCGLPRDLLPVTGRG